MPQPEILRLPASLAAVLDQEIDIAAVHCMEFSRNRRMVGWVSLLQSTFMSLSAAFLLTQIPATPRLALQMSVVSVLLGAGALVFASHALRDLRGFLQLDPYGLAARFGIRHVRVVWDEVVQWRINDIARNPILSAVEVWTKSSPDALQIPGGMISPTDLQRVRQLLNIFAAGKERTSAIDYRPAPPTSVFSFAKRFRWRSHRTARDNRQSPPGPAS